MFKNIKKLQVLSILIFLILIYLIGNIFFENKTSENLEIETKLITSVHEDLPFKFETNKEKIKIQPGEVTTIRYKLKNLSNKKMKGMATFQVYPSELKDYMTKMNCFCYEEQTLKAGETEKYALVLLVDPNVTKNIKEAIIQFIFFKK